MDAARLLRAAPGRVGVEPADLLRGGEVNTSVVAIDKIRLDGGTQPREFINEATVFDYAEAMERGENFPPVVLFHDGANYWPGDGFHRIHAARRNGLESIPADVHVGTKRDAVLFSVSANQGHGLQRTNADKRKAVMTLLKDAEWGKWTDREIGRRVGVDHKTVAAARESLGKFPSEPAARTYTTKHGTEAVMRTQNIGRAKPEAAAVAVEEPPPAPPVQRRPLPPSNGMQFARIAVMKLEEIQDNDTERDEAFAYVRRWLDAR
jgi:hypothetical protein